MAWCLIKSDADKFKKMLRSGEISPQKLNSLTSAERRAFFATHFGKENAQQINAKFEKTLLLKSQRDGMVTWAKQVLDSNPRAKSTALNKINKLTEALDKRELDVFLEDLVATKTGFNVSEEEFDILSKLGEEATTKKDIALSKMEDGKWKSEADKNKYGIDFGAAKVAFDNYFSDLSLRAKGTKLGNIKETFKERGVAQGSLRTVQETGNFIAENSRALVASWDNSFWGRQGRRALGRVATSKDWLKNFGQSFLDAKDVLVQGVPKGNEILDSVKAEIYSRENYLNGRYEMGQKLDVGVREEEFPTSAAEKIPGLGRLFKTSEVTYEAGATRLRADIADTFYKMAEKQQVNLNDSVEVGAINDIVNIMTGRGSLKLSKEHAELANKVFFSIKFAKSQIQAVTKPFTAKTLFAKKQASLNLAALVGSSGVILATIYTLFPDKVEKDPRSTNFGKIRIGNQWVDITGGLGSYLVLASRLIMQSYKNTNTGIVTNLNEGFGSNDGMGVITDFIQNKTSPIASVVKNIINQRTFSGETPSIFTETKSLLTPIIVDTGKESFEQRNSKADLLIAIIADGFGLSVSNYIFHTSWDQSTSKELTEFREKVGEKAFKEANKQYNKEVANFYLELAGDAKYQAMTIDDRQKFIDRAKARIKKSILREFKDK